MTSAPGRLRTLLPPRLRAMLGLARRRSFAILAGPLQPAVPDGSVLAFCHCHDADLVPELARCLTALPRGAAVHVSSSNPKVFETWPRSAMRATVTFHAVENRGRDLLPFLKLARGLAIGSDAAVLKIHGKRSGYSAQGEWWRRDTLRGLLPGPFAAARIRRRFDADPRLALIGAPGSFIANPIYWGANRAGVERLRGAPVADEDLGFVAGTMFWIRGAFLADLLPRIDADAFEPEPVGRDGTYAHAVERFIGLAALDAGWRVGETDRPTPLTRGEARTRTVPYF